MQRIRARRTFALRLRRICRPRQLVKRRLASQLVARAPRAPPRVPRLARLCGACPPAAERGRRAGEASLLRRCLGALRQRLAHAPRGACAQCHPVGSTGSRIIVTLINALEHYGKKRGVAALCIGGGEATAMAIELV